MLARFAISLLGLLPAVAVRLDQSALAASQDEARVAGGAKRWSLVPMRATPPTLGAAARSLPPVPLVPGTWSGSHTALDVRPPANIFERDGHSEAHYFLADIDGIEMRFGVMPSALFLRPVLIAQMKVHAGKDSWWHTLPVQAYEHEDRVSDSGAWTAGWTSHEQALARDLLGLWKTPRVDPHAGLLAEEARCPETFIFDLDRNGRMTVAMQGLPPHPMLAPSSGIKPYFDDDVLSYFSKSATSKSDQAPGSGKRSPQENGAGKEKAAV